MSKKRGSKSQNLSLLASSPTLERQGQNGGIIENKRWPKTTQKQSDRHIRAREECVLDSYIWRGILSRSEYKAGLKFRRAYLRAVLRIKISDNGAGSHGDHEMKALLPLQSEEILSEAYNALSLAQKSLIISVCGHDSWAGGTYKLETLRRGLQILATIWKIK